MFRDNIQFKNLIDSQEEKFLNNYWATYKRILFESLHDVALTISYDKEKQEFVIGE